MTRLESRRDSGSAVLLAIFAFVLMAGIGGALFSMALSGQKTTQAATNADAAYHVAEAGVDDAINKMKAYHQASTDKDSSSANTQADYAVIGVSVKTESGTLVNEVKGSFQHGNYTVTIEPPFAGVGDYKITSIGEANGEKRGIITYISAIQDSSVFKYGLFGDVYMDAGGNIKTDGYDSSKGPYATQAVNKVGGDVFANKTGHVGSNGKVDISGSSVVYGNATPGPGETVTGGGKVHGSTTPAKQKLPLPDTDFTLPAGTTSVGTISKTTTLSTGVYDAKAISMSSKTVLTIKGDVTIYVSGNIDVTGQAKLTITPGSTLTIYQSSSTSTFKLAGGSTINSDKLPSSLVVYSNAASGTLTGNADFYGTVYAPHTAVKIAGNSGMFGSTIANTIDIQGTPFFHYDETLGGITTNTVSFGVKAVQQFVP